MPSVRETCLAAIVDQLETLTTANGYSCSAGASVYRCLPSIPAASLPGISVWDGPETSTLRYGAVESTMDVLVVLHQLSTDRPDAGALIEDIYRCLSSMSLSGSAMQRLTYQSARPQYPEDGSRVLQIESRWQCAYRYLRTDPSSEPTVV